jgi:ribonucleoside-diphosphate reductase alpha chain
LPDALAKVLAKHCDFKVNGKVEDRVTLKQIQTVEQAVLAEEGKTTNGKALSQAAGELLMQQLSLPNTGLPKESVVTSGSSTSLFDLCPKCGTSSFAYEEGCKKCYGCGYSEC